MPSQKQYAIFAPKGAPGRPSIPTPTAEWQDEEGLQREIAYCKARLADIEKAPPNSLHRRGWGEISRRLERCQTQLARLRRR